MALKTNAATYVIAQTSAVILDAAMATQKTLAGLTGMALPIGVEGTTITVSEMGVRIDKQVSSGAAYIPLDIVANYGPGDPSQVILQDAAVNGTLLTTLRFYIKSGCDFVALDLINDSAGAYQIGTFSNPTALKNAIYQNNITFLPGGSSITFIAHSTPALGANIAFLSETTTGAGATATLSTGTWEAFGFEVDDTVIIDWLTAGTDPIYAKVGAISTTLMTFVESVGDSADITDVTGIATTQVHGATPIEIDSYAATC